VVYRLLISGPELGFVIRPRRRVQVRVVKRVVRRRADEVAAAAAAAAVHQRRRRVLVLVLVAVAAVGHLDADEREQVGVLRLRVEQVGLRPGQLHLELVGLLLQPAHRPRAPYTGSRSRASASYTMLLTASARALSGRSWRSLMMLLAPKTRCAVVNLAGSVGGK